MRWLVLVLLALATQGWAQERMERTGFNAPLASSVFAAALTFMVPRTIEAVTPPQLVAWGLHGTTALDPALVVQVRGGALVLELGGKAQYQRAAPAAATAEAWAAAAADVFAAAWELSPALQQAGTEGVIASFFDEVFNHLDPYSRYIPPVAADADRARRSGEAGVGLTVVRRGGAVVVSNVNADGPAGEAGVAVGDRIIMVDGASIRTEPAATVMGMLSGSDGSVVVVAVRGRDGRTRTLQLERAVVPPETVFPQSAGDVLTIRIGGFSADTAQRLARELDEAFQRRRGAARSPRGLVLDLRGNRGGLLRQAVAVADLLLDAGVIAVTEGRNPDASRRWDATGGDVTNGVPVVVVVDGRTASAAEVLAAALADGSRAVVVGSSTLGKGLVQTVVTLPDGGELFVTWSRVLAPRGWPIQGLGVLPQVCSSLGQDGMQQQLASLQQGTLRLQAALERHRATRAPALAADILERRTACPASEPREGDMQAARWLLDHPAAYDAARLKAAHPIADR